MERRCERRRARPASSSPVTPSVLIHGTSRSLLLAIVSVPLFLPISSAFVLPYSPRHVKRPSGLHPSIVNGNYHEVALEEFQRTNGDAKGSHLQTEESESKPDLLIEKPVGRNTTAIDESFSNPNGDGAVPICRVVTLSDGKLPTSPSALPSSLFSLPNLLHKLDDIYHAMAHDEIRRLPYIADPRSQTYNPQEEQQLVSAVRTSLEDAGYELLTRRDLDLCEALNAGYLLRLSLLPDLTELDPSIAPEFYPELFSNGSTQPLSDDELLFEGRILLFWRGYSQEISRGRLLLPKLDYLQASLVQQSAAWVKERLDGVERWLSVYSVIAYRRVSRTVLRWMYAVAKKIPNQPIAKALQSRIKSSVRSNGRVSRGTMERPTGRLFGLARYGGSRIRFVGSPNPTDALTPFVICEEEDCASPCPNARDSYFEGLNGSRSGRDVDRDMYEALNSGDIQCPYDSMNTAPGEKTPSMQLLERVSVSNLVDVFTREGRKNLLDTTFMKSELVEPTYEEVVAVWRPLPKHHDMSKPRITPPQFLYEIADMFDIEGLPEKPSQKEEPVPLPLQIRAFSGVPMANLLAVMPKTKLIFRPADAFVFDFTTIATLLLAASSLKFDSTRLDILALVTVSFWAIRTIFRYSNKLARYDLLVKKFLTSKISHRNSGALKYVATEAGSQRATRAALVHSWLTRWARNSDETDFSRMEVIRDGQHQVNQLIQDDKEIPIDVDAALNDLEDLQLVSSTADGGRLKVVHDSRGIVDALRSAWSDIFEDRWSLSRLVGGRR